jgi:hypothetical protein
MVRHLRECGGAGAIVVLVSVMGGYGVSSLDLGGRYAQRRSTARWVTVVSVYAEQWSFGFRRHQGRERSNERHKVNFTHRFARGRT